MKSYYVFMCNGDTIMVIARTEKDAKNKAISVNNGYGYYTDVESVKEVK